MSAAATNERVRKRSVTLTDDELVLLDGRCSPKVQSEVDAARDRIASRDTLPDLSPVLAGFVADVVTEARRNGRLCWTRTQIGYCPLCGTSAGYVPYKSGPNRGQPNHKRPKVLQAVEFARRFVVIRGSVSVGGCTNCVDPLIPVLADALRGVEAEIPEKLRTPGERVWQWNQNRHCKECGWTGHEGEMGRLRTVLGDGDYAASCPSCGAENRFLGPQHVEIADGFTLTEAAS